MASLDSLKTPDWTLSLDKPGEVLTDLAAIDQNVRIICYTQKFSDPMEPELGVDQLSAIDKPVNQVIPFLIKEITDQISRFEKRIILKSVVGSLDPKAGGYEVLIAVTWEYYNQLITTKLLYKQQ